MYTSEKSVTTLWMFFACYPQEVTKAVGYLDGHGDGISVTVIVWPVRQAGQRQENQHTQHKPLYSWDIQYL